MSRGEKSEVPVVAAVVLVCLPADKPQGSHETFEARTREEEEGIYAEKHGEREKTMRKKRGGDQEEKEKNEQVGRDKINLEVNDRR